MLNLYDKYGEEVDNSSWVTSAKTINALYDPQTNTIIFPAGVLQAPLYSIDQSDSANLGGIGVVIAHEISHAFDTKGALFDSDGNQNAWWSEENYNNFQTQVQDLVNQFDGYQTQGGQFDGGLTIAENIADNGGISVSLQAMEKIK